MGLFDEDVCETEEVGEEWEGGIVRWEFGGEVDALLWDGFIKPEALESAITEMEMDLLGWFLNWLIGDDQVLESLSSFFNGLDKFWSQKQVGNLCALGHDSCPDWQF